jgi:succinate dehydrogenase / fumarate reductase cytochrome b subunit
MSTTSAVNPKGPRVYLPGARPADWVVTYFGSTVGKKVLTALTGLGLTTFVIIHLIGNLKVLDGRDSINAYAHFLKHDIGIFLWIGRGSVLALLVLHVALAVRLHAATAAARPVGYVRFRPAQAPLASRAMLSTGVVVGLFVLFHIAHFTLGWVKGVWVPDPTTGELVYRNYLELTDDRGRHDVYSMMVAGFTTPWVAVLYLVAQVFLAAHLLHGVKSSLQTLGLVGRRFSRAARGLAYLVAGGVLIGNSTIVLAVWLGYCPPVYPVG